MRNAGSTDIIAKKNIQSPPDLLLWGIIVVATFLRVFRLDALTEFLGDQGRAVLVLYDWVHRGIFPLAGPTTLSGQHLGPFFYYLLFPGYLLSGGPVGVSLWMALLGVLATYLLYKTINIIYGRVPALAVSLLYAVAPAIVKQDRIIWEPNLVPLFAILFAWLLIQQHNRISFRRVLAQGAVCGILVQLHYPNVFFIGLLAIVSFGHSVRLKLWRYIPIATLGWLIGFMVILAPFLIYESAHGFTDIRGTYETVVNMGTTVGKRETLLHAWEYAGRVIGKMLPNVNTPVVVLFFIGWFIFLIGHFTSWNVVWTIWFLLGSLAIGRYSGVVFDHYLNFLIPVPFFMLGSVISAARSKVWQVIVLGCVGVVVVTQLGKTDIFSGGTGDIGRTSQAVRQMIQGAGSSPFSFTLIRSRSFSDLHYRYYFRVMGREPEQVMSDGYKILYLVCGKPICPDVGSITSQLTIPVMCYDAHCSEFYPSIPLAKDWSFVREEPIGSTGVNLGELYVFYRK